MADSDHTLGYRFAESKIFAKTHSLHSTEHLLPSFTYLIPQSIGEQFAELMETLRLHINAVLRLPLPVQKRSRLLRNYWELEHLVKEVRLLIDPVALAECVALQREHDVFGSM